MKSSSRSSKRDAWNASSTQEEGKSGQAQSPPAYGISLADSGSQAIQAFRGFPKQQKGAAFRESKDKSFHPDSQYQLRPANDAYEQQADRLAEKIMGQQPVGEPVKKLNPPATTAKNKKGGQQGEGVNAGIAQEIKNARGKGRPLPDVIRQPAEKALGKDLSRVRLHTGTQANQINRGINAEAAAVNQDIFATRRAADIHSPESRALLLHETIHTVQQKDSGRSAPGQSIQRGRWESFKNLFRRRQNNAGQNNAAASDQAPPPPVMFPNNNIVYSRLPDRQQNRQAPIALGDAEALTAPAVVGVTSAGHANPRPPGQFHGRVPKPPLASNFNPLMDPRRAPRHKGYRH